MYPIAKSNQYGVIIPTLLIRYCFFIREDRLFTIMSLILKGSLKMLFLEGGFGGIVDIEMSPDGFLYILTIKKFQHDDQGTIYRIVPKTLHDN